MSGIGTKEQRTNSTDVYFQTHKSHLTSDGNTHCMHKENTTCQAKKKNVEKDVTVLKMYGCSFRETDF